MATIQKKRSRGHTYWQIVESRRVNGKPRPVVLLHLGTAETLLHRLQEGNGKPVKARIIQFGAIAALWNIAKDLGVIDVIDKHVPKRNQGLTCGQYMLLAAINRCVSSTSKKSLYQWYKKTVLTRLLPAPKGLLCSQRFWDHMSYLDEKSIAAIENDLTGRLVNDFKVGLKTLIFDATNFDTFIDTQTPSELVQRGHAKSKREDLRILGLALLVSTDFHVPLFSQVYPGNRNDAKMFAGVTEGLIARYQQFSKECQEITLVFDGGNTSQKNLEVVDASPYHFITSLTLTYHKDLLEVPLKQFESFKESRLEGTMALRATKEVWGQQRTIVVTHSEELLRGQIAGTNAYLKKKRSALRQLQGKLRRSQTGRTRGKGYTRESLQQRLKEITKGQYISEILKTEISEKRGKLDFTFWTDAQAFVRLKRTRFGKRILCTDNDQWSTCEIILGSRAQFHVENAFKQMKDPHWITFSPAFHWTDQKLRVHASYCVLALTLGSLLQRKAAQAGVDLSIPKLLEELSDITEVVNLYPSQTGSGQGRFRAQYVLSERTPLQQRLSNIFGINVLAHR